ncbi:MAG: glycosyltransferase family 2 protein [Bacteroidetes bacterium]|nr:MAG: glycosyltransferase family 2 protein [Bacteroidota bacterium]
MKYSIILPVFNGGEYLKLCVKSILGQSFSDFNLLVLDSGSSDGSIEWIEGLNDDRIKIYPTEKRLTIEENWTRIRSIPRNEFMTIIGHDDLFDKNYLQMMDELINRYPDASLYQSHFRFIDAAGSIMRKCKAMNEKISPAELLKHFLNSSIDTMGTGFIMRSNDFDEVGGMPNYPKLLFADMELWQRLTDKNYLAVEQAELFSYRRHSGATTASTDISVIIQALEKFIDYLSRLSSTDQKYAELIRNEGNTLLKQYCQGLSHKLLRTPVTQRNNLTVARVIDEFRKLGKKLNTKHAFEPLDHFKIKLGKIIDSSAFLQSAYLSFRSLLKK